MQPLAPLISAMGVTQIVSWGTLFYAIGVLGPAMRSDLGVSEVFLFGAFTAGLFISGTLAPRVGRMVDRHGGRVVLSAGSLVAAAAMFVLALAWNPLTLVVGWLLAGVAMAVCLYDPAFATLSQHTGERYRKAVTALTLFGGFASTIFWPLSHILMQAWGWRATFAIYGGLHLFLCLSVHLLFLPRRLGVKPSSAAAAQRDAATSPFLGSARLRWLTASFALATFTFSVIAVHIVELMVAASLTEAQAVSIAMLVGPMQVVGRVLELGFATRIRSVTVGLAAFALMLVALASLIQSHGVGIAVLVFVIAYGCGNGILTIVRGTVPAELFGREGLGGLLGNLSRAGLYARALAPVSFSAMLAIGYSRNTSLVFLGVLALAGLGCYAMAIRPPAAPGRMTQAGSLNSRGP